LGPLLLELGGRLLDCRRFDHVSNLRLDLFNSLVVGEVAVGVVDELSLQVDPFQYGHLPLQVGEVCLVLVHLQELIELDFILKRREDLKIPGQLEDVLLVVVPDLI